MKTKLKLCNHQIAALKYENCFLKTKMKSHTEIIQMTMTGRISNNNWITINKSKNKSKIDIKGFPLAKIVYQNEPAGF